MKGESTNRRTTQGKGWLGRPPTALNMDQTDVVASCMPAGVSRQRSGRRVEGDEGRNGGSSGMGRKADGQGYRRVARVGREPRVQ